MSNIILTVIRFDYLSVVCYFKRMTQQQEQVRINLLLDKTDVDLINKWRSEQKDFPNRSEAIRRLLALGLKKSD